MNNNSKVFIVSAPTFSPLIHPPLGPAILSAYLNSKNIYTEQVNLDSSFIEWIIKKANYKNFILRGIDTYNKLQNKKYDLSETEFQHLCDLINVFKNGVDKRTHNAKYLSEVNEFNHKLEKDGVKDVIFREIERFLFNHKLIHNYLTLDQIISKVDDPSDITCKLLNKFFSVKNIKDILFKISQSKLLGFSVHSSEHLFPSIFLSKLIKQINPNVPIIFGGPQVTLLSKEEKEKILSFKFIDYIGLYEGESTLEELYNFKCGLNKIKNVPNLVYRDKKNIIIENKIDPPIHINDLPTPEFNEEYLKIFSKYLFIQRQNSNNPQELFKQLPVYVTRGCFWNKCTFCDYIHVFSQFKYTQRDPEKVVDDIIKLQKKHSIFSFDLISEALPIPWIKKFCNEIISKQVEASFSCFMRHTDKDTLSSDVIVLMRTAGFTQPVFGTESFIDRILELMKKGVKFKMIEDNYNMFNVNNLGTWCNLIPDFPSITNEEMNEFFAKMISFRDIIPNIVAQPFDLSSLSQLAKDPEGFGIKVEGKIARSHGMHSLKFTRTKGITEQERLYYIPKFVQILNELKLYRETVNVRERIESQDFNWKQAKFAFNNLLIIPSTFSLIEKGKKKNVYLLCSPENSYVLEFPASYNNVISIILSNVGNLINFNDFLESYKSDCLKTNYTTDETILNDCIADLKEFVYKGIIKNVTNGGHFKMPDFEVSKNSNGINIFINEADSLTYAILKERL